MTDYDIIKTTNNTLEQQTKGRTEVQAAIARANPRIPERSLQRIGAAATRSPEIAGECFYSIPRGGKQIEGPSVRLAEFAARYWGNIEAASRIIDIGETHVTAQGVAWDLETNYTFSTEVRRKIVGKNGRRFNEDMIGITCNAAASIAYREAVLRVIGKSELDPIWKSAREVAVGGSRSLGERYRAAVDHFAKLGVDEARVLGSVDKGDASEILAADIEKLLGVANALRDGEVELDTAFPPPAPPQPVAGKHSFIQPKEEPNEQPASSFADASAKDAIAMIEGVDNACDDPIRQHVAKGTDDPRKTVAEAARAKLVAIEAYRASRDSGLGEGVV